MFRDYINSGGNSSSGGNNGCDHRWTDWVTKSQFVNYNDGLYYESWSERYCIDCFATQRANYQRRGPIPRG